MMKILIVRFSSIGDLVLTTPVIRCVKQQLGAEVHVLTFSRFRQVLANNPYIDQLISVDKTIREVVPQLRHERYDLIVDLHRNIRTLSLKLRLRRPSVSFRKLNFRKYLLVRLKINVMPEMHIVDRYLDTVRSLGVTNDGEGLNYDISDHDLLAVERLPVSFRSGYAVMVVGGRYVTKIYPEELAAKVVSSLQIPVVLLGGAEDNDRAAQIIAEKTANEVFNGCGLFALNESAAVVQHAAVVITNDTGLMHVAAAFKKNIVSVWGNTVPDLGMSPYLPAGISQRSILIEAEGVRCRPCSKLGYATCPKGHFRCMLSISPEAITDAVGMLIGEKAQS
jgi:ADP-heptose:LPS heptosyltransferase